jgi:hypothetical protein
MEYETLGQSQCVMPETEHENRTAHKTFAEKRAHFEFRVIQERVRTM